MDQFVFAVRVLQLYVCVFKGNLKIVSLNVRGLNNGMKRRKIFRYLKRQEADICLIQETFCTKRNEYMWSSEWGSKCLFSNGQSNSCGVAVLFNRQTSNMIDEIKRDVNGRFLQVKLKLHDKSIGITNIYAPNNDDPAFFEYIFREIEALDCNYNIIGGDFNVVREAKDRSTKNIYHKKSKEIIDSFVEANDYSDVWRSFNPDKKFFTHVVNSNNVSWSRIDYFLVSQAVQLCCTEASIKASVNTDHSLITMEMSFSDCKRGPGTWKFNNTWLNDEKFVKRMNDVILNCNKCFSYLEDLEYWDLLKFECMQFCRNIASKHAAEEKWQRFESYDKLGRMQQEYINDITPDPQLARNMQLLKEEINSYETIDAKRSAFRCKKQWTQCGERSSKYYFNMEKRNFLNKTMYMAYNKNNVLTKDYTEILNIQYEFYSELYTADPRVVFDLKNNSGVKLSNILHDKMEELITVDELFDAVMTLRSNKTPGGDGLTVEFYRKFWNALKVPLYNGYKKALDRGKFGRSTRRGIINLIPKKNRNEFYVKSWRPIVLLNIDLKIWSKAIANRLEETTHLIGQQQQGFIKNRSIFNNILTTWEVVAHLKKKNTPGIICMIDFEKCFDRISFKSIEGTFRYFGFGNNFLRMLLLLFQDIELCTSSNGFMSKYLTKGRGTNQGDPSSPLIYSFCGEIMAHLIFRNNDIKGIDLDGLKQILSQFADDTASFLSYELLTLNAFVEELKHVEAQMGLKVPMIRLRCIV